MKKLSILFFTLLLSITVMAQNVYDFNVLDRKGNEVSLSEYKGKVLLIVNTATRCGFTPQYEELEALYKVYRDKGLEILDFPCNQFGQQTPGSEEEIHSFCQLNYGTEFPQFEVNGENQSPLFAYLKAQKGFASKPDIKWNFTKFLINQQGEVVARYEPTHDIKLIEQDIVNLLK